MIEAEARDPLANMDANVPNPGDILLRVKSANHPCEDLEFHAKVSFSVKQIKETIQRLSAQHPEVKEQRLIYSGHLLDDNQLLKDVLSANSGTQMSNNPQQPVTIHLACTSKYIFGSSTSNASKTNAQKTPGLSPSGLTQQPLFNQQGFSPSDFGISVPPQYEGVNPPDMYSLHQAYVAQMTAYMNQWYMQQSFGGMFYQMPPPGGVGSYSYNYTPAPQPAPVPPMNDPVANPNIPNPVNANGNRPQENLAAARPVDEEDQRDLLDWMYTLSRVVLVFSVVYFYSSFSRFLLVVVFTGLVMILQRRNGRGNQNQNADAPGQDANNPPAPAPPAPPAEQPGPDPNIPRPTESEGNTATATQPEATLEGQQGQEEGQSPPQAEVEGEGSNSDNPPPVAPVAPVPQRNIQDIAVTFLTTFFTSLIPETYQNN